MELTSEQLEKEIRIAPLGIPIDPELLKEENINPDNLPTATPVEHAKDLKVCTSENQPIKELPVKSFGKILQGTDKNYKKKEKAAEKQSTK